MSVPVILLFDVKVYWPISVIRCLCLLAKACLKLKISSSFAFGGAQKITINIFGPTNREFQISKLFYLFKQINKMRPAKFARIRISWFGLTDILVNSPLFKLVICLANDKFLRGDWFCTSPVTLGFAKLSY